MKTLKPIIKERINDTNTEKILGSTFKDLFHDIWDHSLWDEEVFQMWSMLYDVTYEQGKGWYYR